MAARRAVIIGVNDYQERVRDPDSDLKLEGAVNDATELRDKLSASGGFEIADEHFLSKKQATGEAIRRAIRDLLWKDDPTEISLFYFSGHGFHDGYGNGFIAPYDVQPKQPLVCGIRMQELTQLLLSAKNKKAAIAILDCCYSGVAADASAKGGSDAQGLASVEDWLQALLSQGEGEGRVVLASSGKDQKSRERKFQHQYDAREPHEHGAFTFHLLEGIDGKAVDSNGAVTLGQLCTFIDKEMKTDQFHKMKVLCSNLSQAQDIIIAQPRHWTNDKCTLDAAENQIAKGEPQGVLAAAVKVRLVLDKSPRLERACKLQEQINRILEGYSNPAISWLTERWTDLLEYQAISDNLQTFAGKLNASTFAAERKLQGLMIQLCRVSQRRPGSVEPYIATEAFMGSLRAYASAERQSPAKPQTDGEKLPARDLGTQNK
jgi:hypothetical protein